MKQRDRIPHIWIVVYQTAYGWRPSADVSGRYRTKAAAECHLEKCKTEDQRKIYRIVKFVASGVAR